MGGNILHPWVNIKPYGTHGVWFSYEIRLRHNLPSVDKDKINETVNINIKYIIQVYYVNTCG